MILRLLSPRNLAFLATLLMMVGLARAKALISIGMVSLAVAALWQLAIDKESRDWRKHIFAFTLGTLFLLPLLSGLWADDIGLWLRDTKTKIAFCVFPLALSILPTFTRKQYYILFGGFILCHVAFAVASVVYYFINFESLNIDIGRNAPMPVIIGGSHIYFGLVLAFSTLLSFDLYLRNARIFHAKEKWIFLVLGILAFICLHIMVARTGLLAFYAGSFAYLLFFSVRKKKWGVGIFMLFILLSVPLISYFTLPSFQQRVNVTLWDLDNYKKKTVSLDHHSAGLRLVSWQAAWDIFKEHPITGTGMGDLKSDLFQWYKTHKIKAKKNQWLSTPHNQYLEMLAGLGVPGLLVLLMALTAPLFFRRKIPSELLITFIALISTGMLTESILERQIGIAFFTLFLMLIIKSNMGDSISTEPKR